MSRALVAVATGMVALPVAAVVVLSTGLSATAPIGYTTTTAATTDIPPAYLRLYQADAALCPGLGWPVLAGVGKVESDHGRAATLVSDTGAAGPMQVEPGTWAGYGVDADRDGRADPFDAADAVATAALYLCRLGADHDVRDALIAYNCGNSGPACQAMSAGYASLVLRWAGRYAVTASGRTGTLGAVAVRAALSQLGTPYLWGGGSPAGFDCSGLSQWSYARAGLSLPRTAQQQYDAGPAVPAGSGLTPGDLVFFGTGPTGVDHVGIYMGNGRMVDAPHTGATVRIDPVAGFTPAYVGATAPTGLG